MSRAPRADAGHDAIVLRVAGPTATVSCGGDEREARLRPQVPGGPAVAGDRVELSEAGSEPAIVGVAPRTTVLERGDGADRRPRAIVANADLVLVVAAVREPPLHARLIDRYLVAAEDGGLGAGIVLTKADLAHDEDEIRAVSDVYRDAGYPVLSGNAKAPALVEAVRELIAGRIAVLAVGAVSAKVGTGRHTTSDPRLIPLPGGGAVVDTAGVRTFHLARMDRARLEAGFPEIARAAAGCRFRGCAHDGDAGCAVEGAVSAQRLDSYRRMLADVR